MVLSFRERGGVADRKCVFDWHNYEKNRISGIKIKTGLTSLSSISPYVSLLYTRGNNSVLEKVSFDFLLD